MTAPADNYVVSSGVTLYGGRSAPAPLPTFDSLTFVDTSDGILGPWADGWIMIVQLHGSSGQNTFNGRQYRAAVSGYMSFPSQTEFGFSTVYISPGVVALRPIDDYDPGSGVKESMHLGFLRSDGKVHLITERRYDTMMRWADANLNFDMNKRVLTGGSMGGWGTISYGVRRYAMFAALYPDRPRWSRDYSATSVAIPNYDAGFISAVAVGPTPTLASEDGGTSYSDYLDMVSYIADTSKKVRWIGWCCGRADGYARFDDQIAAVNALRAAKRGFAFAWNEGNHSTGSIMGEIYQSYPYGTFRRDQGYPLFTDHSGDQDPNVDLVGGINIGLTFRNVVESANGWSCEVTSVLGARTVKVEPISEVFITPVTKQTVTVPAANTWVAVSFTV